MTQVEAPRLPGLNPVTRLRPAQNQNETKSEPTGSNEGTGLSLKDIFEEEVEIDEALRDLPESMEDIPAQEIADDLRAFFEELEASMR